MAPKLKDDSDLAPDVTQSGPQMTLKSSFHLLKKNSMKRGEFLPCIHDWFEAKRRDDDVGNYWRVHDKLYNLESFIKNHPGGPDWIENTRGTDITEAFESAHMINLNFVERTLAEFYVADATHPRNSPYTFKENGFYKTLKRKVEPVLKKVGTGPTTECLMLQDGMFVTFAILGFMGMYFDSFLFQIAAGIVMGMCVVGGHNFLHQRDTWRRYYFDLIPFSSYEWRLTHGLSHHLFPNSVLDFEVQLGEPMMEFLPHRSRNWIKSYGAMIYSHVLYTQYANSEFLKRVRAIYRGTQTIRPENFIVFAEAAIAFFIAPSVWAWFKGYVVITSVASYMLTFNNANAHHHPTTFHDGDEARTDPDFGLCQVDASKSKTDWYHQSTLAIMTTFGDHPMHHLFPTVDVSKQKYIKGIVLETLKEYGELYPEMEQWELFKGSHMQMLRTEPHKIDVYKSRKY